MEGASVASFAKDSSRRNRLTYLLPNRSCFDILSHTKFEAGSVSGLDDILQAVFREGHLFLLEGEPGAGKTTIALQFLRRSKSGR